MSPALPPISVGYDTPFAIERTFAAPLATVWRAFTDRDRFAWLAKLQAKSA